MSVLTRPYFSDEKAAFAKLEEIVWPNGPACPHCGNKGEKPIYDLAKTRIGLKKCGSCRKQFTVRVGTVFESSHIPMRKWLQVAYLLCSSKEGYLDSPTPSNNGDHLQVGVVHGPSFA